MKKMIIRFIFGLTAGLLISGSASAATQVDSRTIAEKVDQLVTKMQQETIKQNFAALLLQNEMRPKMMAERVPQNFMQESFMPIIRPGMIEKVRAEFQAQQMERMMLR